MFGKLFGKTSPPSIHSLRIDTWTLTSVTREPNFLAWRDPVRPESLSVNFFLLKPDIPFSIQSETLGKFRDFFRESFIAGGLSLLSLDVVSAGGVPTLKILCKARIPDQPHGFLFQGTLLIPFRDFSYVIKVQAIEAGTTGIREAVVMFQDFPNPEIEEGTGKMLGWMKDPYDSRFDDQTLVTLADNPKYDVQFPDHPLSRVRFLLEGVRQSVEFEEPALSAPRFG